MSVNARERVLNANITDLGFLRRELGKISSELHVLAFAAHDCEALPEQPLQTLRTMILLAHDFQAQVEVVERQLFENLVKLGPREYEPPSVFDREPARDPAREMAVIFGDEDEGSWDGSIDSMDE